MENSEHDNYLLDLCSIIKEKALEAKKNKDNALNTDEYDFRLGILMAYHDIVSIVKQQADAFGIDQSDISLNDIDPDTDLL